MFRCHLRKYKSKFQRLYHTAVLSFGEGSQVLARLQCHRDYRSQAYITSHFREH